MRRVLYMAHPVAPTAGELAEAPVFSVSVGTGEYEPDMQLMNTDRVCVGWAVRRNLDRAQRWLSWLRRSFPETTFIAPWISSILAGVDEHDPNQREQGLIDDCAVVERCDGIVLCGPRISSGMARERDHFQTALRDRTLRLATSWGLSAAATVYGMAWPDLAIGAAVGRPIVVYDLTPQPCPPDDDAPFEWTFEQWFAFSVARGAP